MLPNVSLRRQRIVPLFPSYLFVYLTAPKEYDYVRWSPGVKCLVNFNGTPVPIEEQVVAFLKGRANAEGILAAHSNLITGQEVRIIEGPFEGLVGIIQDPPDAKGRVGVLMKLLGRQVNVDIPVRFLESEWVIKDLEEENRGLRSSNL